MIAAVVFAVLGALAIADVWIICSPARLATVARGWRALACLTLGHPWAPVANSGGLFRCVRCERLGCSSDWVRS